LPAVLPRNSFAIAHPRGPLVPVLVVNGREPAILQGLRVLARVGEEFNGQLGQERAAVGFNGRLAQVRVAAVSNAQHVRAKVAGAFGPIALAKVADCDLIGRERVV
jgi:hypothetical protein